MAARARLDTKGFADYLERIARAGRDVDKAADSALQAGGEVLAVGMRQRVAKDTRNLEQHLGKSEPKGDGNYHFVLVGIVAGTDAETARYGNAQEYGSSSMPAHPYIRPALDEDMGKAKRAMRASFEQDGLL